MKQIVGQYHNVEKPANWWSSDQTYTHIGFRDEDGKDYALWVDDDGHLVLKEDEK